MNLQSEKKSLIEWLSSIEDEVTIEQIKLLKENSINGVDWWSQISEEEKEGIENGLKDIEEGRESSFEEVKEKIQEMAYEIRISDRASYEIDKIFEYLINNW